jgi:hypothetical protein
MTGRAWLKKFSKVKNAKEFRLNILYFDKKKELQNQGAFCMALK